MKLKILAIFFCIATATTAFAQKLTEYQKMAAELEQKIWGTPDPLFESNKVPDEYKNESAVILAQKHTIETDSKRKGLFYPRVQGSFMKTIREKIYIADQASLDEYSQLSYNKIESKRRGIVGKNIAYTFLAIRLIKPDGSIQKVNVDAESVTVKETEDASKKKIAIPGLAIGDIIDYYVTSYDKSEAVGNNEIMMFVLSDEYPVVNYNINILFDKRIAAEYQCINGAPDFKIKPGQDENDNILEINTKNLPKFKNALWSSIARQMPLARVRYSFGGIYRSKTSFVEKGEVKKVATANDIETDFQNSLAYVPDVSLYESIKKEWKTYAKKHNINPENQDSIAAFVFYYFRYDTFGEKIDLDANFRNAELNISDYKQLGRGMAMCRVLEENFDIKAEVLMITGRNSVKKKDLFVLADLSFMIRAFTPKPVYFNMGSSLYNYGEVNPYFEGEDGKFVSYKSKKTGIILRRIIGFEVENEGQFSTPKTTAADNISIETITVELDKSNNQLLQFSRNIHAKGHLRRDSQSEMLNLEDYFITTRKYLDYDTDMQQYWTSKGREYRKSWDELNSLVVKAREKVKEDFEREIADQFDNKPKEVKDYKIISTGLHHTDDGFKASQNFSMDGWIKKAGNNLIVEAGKFIGSHLEIKQEQRERKLDVYMSYPRTFTYNITFTIPDGYTAEGLDKLNKKVESEVGGFVSTAKVEGNKLLLTAKKYYNNYTEPVANWSKLAAIVDAAFEYTKEKILLKKK